MGTDQFVDYPVGEAGADEVARSIPRRLGARHLAAERLCATDQK
jgi:hypothetical protein